MTTPGERPTRTVRLERKLAITESIDGLIEQCRRARLPLAQAMNILLPRTCELLDARGAAVRGLDEQLERRDYRHGHFPEPWLGFLPERLDVEPLVPNDIVDAGGSATLVLRRLDCADVVLGVAAFAYGAGLEGDALEQARDECRTAAETIDNFLEGIAAAARKQRLTVSASTALRSSVLEEGADRAVDLLSSSLGLEEVALVFAGADGCGVHYRLYRQGRAVADSFDNPHPGLTEAVKRAGRRALDPDNRDIADVLGGLECVETALINGMVDVSPVGKLVVRNAVGNLNPEGMDVLHIFAECLSQRLVDYNRERRHLAEHFPPDVVTQLVREPCYERKHLSPRVEPVALLFSDIASFTAICEQVLGDARRVGELIDAWSAGAVRVLFEHGGVFDKLVGDCVIGIFGPPFFKSSPAERVAAAVRAAVGIARMTRDLGRAKGYDAEIAARGIGPGLATAAGVNFGGTSVGLFGPNQDYTGFSEHMNNTARLQGCAKANEVLIMSGAREVLGDALVKDGLGIEGPDQAKVKNVKEPISFFRVAGV